PEGRIGKVVAAVDQTPARLTEVPRQRLGIDEGGVGKAHCAAASASLNQTRASSSSGKTSTSASTKSCVSHALQASHWSSVRTAIRPKSLACRRENLSSSQATSRVKPTISRRSKSRLTGPSNLIL